MSTSISSSARLIYIVTSYSLECVHETLNSVYAEMSVSLSPMSVDTTECVFCVLNLFIEGLLFLGVEWHMELSWSGICMLSVYSSCTDCILLP